MPRLLESSAHRLRGAMPDMATTQRGGLVGSVVVDAVGAGMVMPLSLLYFTLTTSMSVATIGLVTSAAVLLTLPISPWAGALVDRYGSRFVLVGNNVIAGVGYVGYLLADNWWQVLVSVFLVTAADRCYWTAWPVFLKSLTARHRLDTWFAFAESVKQGGFAIGGLAAAAFLSWDDHIGARLLVGFNVLSSLLSAWLLARVRPTSSAQPLAAEGLVRTDRAPVRGAWRHVLAQRWLWALAVGQIGLSFLWLVPTVVLPVHVVDGLGLGAWLPTALFGLNCLGAFALQSWVTRRSARMRRTRVVVLSAGLGILAVAVIAALPSGRPAVAATGAAVASLLVGFAFMCYLPASSALVAAAADTSHEGRTMSVFQSAGALTSGVGPAVVGWLLTAGAPWLWWLVTVACALGGAGFWAAERWLPARALHRGEEPGPEPQSGAPAPERGARIAQPTSAAT
ncbi:MFS transporter [Streptomyces sp. NPDC059445]|uniref:MFS transporter n=1 Tax=Streptomyces sp. NPDC059445 TaxID=3346832 RepID=UPI0036C11852